jgi:hypothetical protein
MPDQTTRNVPAGGPATINGVLYQLLWSVLQASRATIARAPVVEGGEPTEVLIVLEPIGGGGDLVVHADGVKLVQQLKARPDGGPWSLREVIESVIPDLYLDSSGTVEDAEFQFVTEGVMGIWKNVYLFFQSLRDRECPDDPLSDLDDTAELKFGKRMRSGAEEQFWERTSYTQRTLFEKVLKHVRMRNAVSTAESELDTCKRLRKLLGRFEFVGEQGMDRIRQQIDSHLLAVVDVNDNVPSVRDSLAMELARRATAGGAEIVCIDFLEERGINAVSLSHFALFRGVVRNVTARTLERLGYRRHDDVRRRAVIDVLTSWGSVTPILAIAGESGSGKSWRGYGICDIEQASERIAVVVTVADTVEATLDRAAREIWQVAAGHDEVIPISQLGRRLRRVVPGIPRLWLTVVVDGPVTFEQAKALILQDWEAWGARLVLTLSANVAEQLERTSHGRCRAITVQDFSDVELHQYLQSVLGESWPSMPEFVRYPLRRPLLASIYRRVVEARPTDEWSPTSEYQVFDECWRQLLNPADQNCIIQLAMNRLDQGHESWSVQQIREASGDVNSIMRLEQAGWLRRANSDPLPVYEFSHARLLNWASALALISRCADQLVTVSDLENQLCKYLWEPEDAQTRRLSFVPMDFLWLACSAPDVQAHVPTIIQNLAGEHYRRAEILYTKLLPTLGPLVLYALIERLRSHVREQLTANLIIQGIVQVGGTEASEAGGRLVRDSDPLVRIEGASVLKSCPSVDALDDLWQLHIDSHIDPDTFLREHELKHFLYKDTIGALSRCSKLSPEWIDSKLATTNVSDEMRSDLVYLLAGLPSETGRPIWLRHKRDLFQRVRADKYRSIATCIDAFSDHDEIDWIVNHVKVKDDFLGARCLRALVRLDPALAVDQLPEIDRQSLSVARKWFCDHLFVSHLNATQDKLREMIQGGDDVWEIASVYDGRFNYVDSATLELLLAHFQAQLEALALTPDTILNDGLHQPLRLLIQANTVSQLQQLSQYAGTVLEQLLVDYVLRIGPRKGIDRDSLTREDAICLLQRFQGDGFAQAISCLLRGDTFYGRLDGMKLASKRANADVIAALQAIIESEETHNGDFWEQSDAAIQLAEIGEWKEVISLVRRIDLKVSRNVLDLARHGLQPDSALLTTTAENASNDPSSITAGDILVLGFGAADLAQIVMQCSESCDEASDIAHACVIALELLRDSSSANVTFLRKQLEIEPHNFSATNALIVNGAPLALESLLGYFGKSLTGAVARTLITKMENPHNAVECFKSTILNKIRTGHGLELANELHRVISRIDRSVAAEILSVSAIEEFVRDGSFADEGNAWFVGSKASAIRCLAVIDTNAAFVAAKAAFRNPNGHDRNYYPTVLLEIDETTALSFLLDALSNETDERVQAAIGRALSSVNSEELILSGLSSDGLALRVASCRAAKWQKWTEPLEHQLSAMLSDSNDVVSREAAESLVALSVEREAELLGEAIINSDSNSDRWLFLDCLLSIADPGDDHHRWPLHGPPIGDVLTPAQYREVSKHLEDCRKY